jgi:bacterioferritin
MPASATKQKGNVPPLPLEVDHVLHLDNSGIESAKSDLQDGAVTPSYGPYRDSIVELLNAALATELVCVLRYKRHYFTAKGLASPRIAEEFISHANEESAHGDRLAERIVQLGGEPDFAPDGLTSRSHADYDESSELRSMVTSNLKAERVAVETYRQMIGLIGDKDPTTRRLLEDILQQEEEHADELKDLLEGAD